MEEFMAITNCNDNDTAMHLLEAADWNVENAVQLYFESAVPEPPSKSSNNNYAPVEQPPVPFIQSENRNLVSDPIPQRVTRLIDSPTASFGFQPNIPSSIQHFFSQSAHLPPFVPPEPVAAAPSSSSSLQQSQSRRSSSPPSEQSSHRKDMYNKLFEKPTSILFQGSFNEAKEAAKRQAKWVLIHLHDSTEFDSLRLNRDTWKDKVLETVIEVYFVFWQSSVQESEAQRVSKIYNVTKYPHVALIDPRTGEQMKYWQGFHPASFFSDELTKFVEKIIMEQPQPVEPPVQLQTAKQQIIAPSKQIPSPVPQLDHLEELEDDPELALAIAASLETAVDPPVQQEQRLPFVPLQSPFVSLQSPAVSQQPSIAVGKQVLPSLFPDDGIDPTQYIVEDTGNSTLLRIRLPAGNLENVRLSLDTPLAAIYALCRQKLPNEHQHKQISIFALPTLLENSRSITLNDKPDLRNAVLTVRIVE